jgi:predicted  nucleic acid-binding Zn-ribbon protein
VHTRQATSLSVVRQSGGDGNNGLAQQSYDASAGSHGPSARIREAQRILAKLRHLPQNAQEELLALVSAMEADVQLVRRRENMRRARAQRVEEDQNSLADELAAAQQRIDALEAELGTASQRVTQLTSALDAAHLELDDMRDEADAIARGRDAMAQAKAGLAACSFAVCARPAESEAEGRSPQRHARGKTQLQRHGPPAVRGPGRRPPRRSLTLLGSTEEVQRFLSPAGADTLAEEAAAMAIAEDAELSESEAGWSGQEAGARTAALQNAEDALLRLVAEAQHSIAIMTHAFTSRRLADALAEAARRGVMVRVVYDASWVDMVVNSGPASIARSSWNKIYRRWRSAGVEHGAQHGARAIGGGAGVRGGRYLPLQHNVMLIDSARLLTGPWRFADSLSAEDASCIVVESDVPGASPCLMQVETFFSQAWARRVALAQPGDVTTVRLPHI